MLKANNLLHRLAPIVGGHFEFVFDDTDGGVTLEEAGVDVAKGNNWFVIFELLNGDAFATVDAETIPLKAGGTGATPGGRPVESGQPYVLGRIELLQLRIIAMTGQTPRFIGQKYFYNELNY